VTGIVQDETTAPAEALADGVDLPEALSRLSSALPLSEAQVNAELVRLRVIDRPARLTRLARAAIRAGWRPTFRVVDIGGTRVAVPRMQVTAAANAYTIASRAVYEWGAATVGAVLDQLRVLASATVGLGFVRGLLIAMKDFQWLDQQRAWFWFARRPSRLLQNMAKVFSVVPELSLARLRAALFRDQEGVHLPPAPVISRICATLPGAFERGQFVGVDPPPDRDTSLGGAERRVVEWLERGGRSVRRDEIRSLCDAVGLSRWTVRKVLESSPLVEDLPGRGFGLVGG
jgi:hypothetical protein